MSYDSNGVWQMIPSYLVNTGDLLTPASQVPVWDDASINGFSQVMVKDGRAPATGNWNMGGFRIGNLGTPVNPADAVTKAYADGFSSTYSLITTNTAVTAADKGKWYRATSALTLAPGAAATLGVNFSFNVKNDSTGTVIIDPSNGTEKINGVDQLVVPPGQSAFVICDGSNYFGYISSSPLVGPQLQGYLFGLTATTNAGTPATNIDVAAGAVGSSASPYYLIQLAASITKNTNNAFAVGSGNGSLDTGAIANSTYYGYLIQRSDTGVVDVLTSLSSTAPTMPVNYDRRSTALFTFTRAAGVNGAPIRIIDPNSIGLRSYQSAEQTITNLGTLSLAHGLGMPPKIVQASIICKTAEGNYSVDNIVPINFQGTNTSSDPYGIGIEYASATILAIKYSSGGIFIGNKTTGTAFQITNANWRLIMRAIA